MAGGVCLSCQVQGDALRHWMDCLRNKGQRVERWHILTNELPQTTCHDWHKVICQEWGNRSWQVYHSDCCEVDMEILIWARMSNQGPRCTEVNYNLCAVSKEVGPPVVFWLNVTQSDSPPLSHITLFLSLSLIAARFLHILYRQGEFYSYEIVCSTTLFFDRLITMYFNVQCFRNACIQS